MFFFYFWEFDYCLPTVRVTSSHKSPPPPSMETLYVTIYMCIKYVLHIHMSDKYLYLHFNILYYCCTRNRTRTLPIQEYTNSFFRLICFFVCFRLKFRSKRTLLLDGGFLFSSRTSAFNLVNCNCVYKCLFLITQTQNSSSRTGPIIIHNNNLFNSSWCGVTRVRARPRCSISFNHDMMKPIIWWEIVNRVQ